MIERCFDAYLFVDWSASSTPRQGKDSVWLAAGCYGEDGPLAALPPENPRTRTLAIHRVRELLHGWVADELRVLVGFDLPYGLPAGARPALYGPESTWHTHWASLAATLVDGADNANNRFDVASALNARVTPPPGPFWGAPRNRATATLTATKPHCNLPQWRRVEAVLRGMRRRPSSVWQLYGNGSVGSQALVGLPRLESLRRDPALASVSAVWPFEPWRGAQVVHVEIWPSLFAVDLGSHPVRDAAQVLSVVAWAAAEDLDGRLAGWLNVPQAPVLAEGWILGVPWLPR